MKAKDLFQMKKVLLNQKSNLLNSHMAYRNQSNCVERKGDEADQAVSEYNTNLSIRFQERERLLVQKISRALAKIEDGSYGYCEDCGDEMSPKRLMARPVAILCISCKENQEIHEKVYA